MPGMNRLLLSKRAQIIRALTEGNSVRATARMADCSQNTVFKLIADVGAACAAYQDRVLRDLPCKRIQCDELWSFCRAKEKNVPAEKKDQFGYGDVWLWMAVCADAKIVPCWHIGRRGADTANEFMADLAGRLRNRVQLTTDGHKAYLEAVERAFGADVDYAMLVKLHEEAPDGSKSSAERKYSPAQCTGCRKSAITGKPDKDHVSTNYIERQNFSMRMSMRRLTRLTNAFSKKVENLAYSTVLHYMHYNFVRVHRTLRVTPAMAAGVTHRLWSVEDILAVADQHEEEQKALAARLRVAAEDQDRFLRLK
jgi:IS1 family transposase